MKAFDHVEIDCPGANPIQERLCFFDPDNPRHDYHVARYKPGRPPSAYWPGCQCPSCRQGDADLARLEWAVVRGTCL